MLNFHRDGHTSKSAIPQHRNRTTITSYGAVTSCPKGCLCDSTLNVTFSHEHFKSSNVLCSHHTRHQRGKAGGGSSPPPRSSCCETPAPIGMSSRCLFVWGRHRRAAELPCGGTSASRRLRCQGGGTRLTMALDVARARQRLGLFPHAGRSKRGKLSLSEIHSAEAEKHRVSGRRADWHSAAPPPALRGAPAQINSVPRAPSPVDPTSRCLPPRPPPRDPRPPSRGASPSGGGSRRARGRDEAM